MVDAVTILAIALLVGGVIATVVPLIPEGVLSLSGLYLYWWHSGFADPGLVGLAALTFLGVSTLLLEYFGGSIAAKAGGASWETTAAAAVVGIALLFVTGPLGFVVGLFATVFALEFYRNGDVGGSTRSAAFATVGVLASTAVQILLTAAILLGFLLLVFVL